jgi:hypothetical protein
MRVFRRSKNRKPMTNATIVQHIVVQGTVVQCTGEFLPLPLFGDLAPIAGVDLAAYGWVTKRIAAYDYDRNLLEGFAASRGISADAWREAATGWAVRMTNPVVASEFRRHYDAS